MQKGQNNFIHLLKEELKKPLPGLEAQMEMVPEAKRGYIANAKMKDAKAGGVLLLLYEKNNRLTVAFIERTIDGGVHSGQISFPGGGYEESDRDLVATALREANEEVGIDIQKVNVLGNLTKIDILASNFRVLPVVGYYNGQPEFTTNPDEVASLIEVPLEHFLENRNKRVGFVDILNRKYEVPVFICENHQIWGATAMMLNEFIQVVKNLNGTVPL